MHKFIRLIAGQSLSLTLMLVIASVLCLGDTIPIDVKELLYSISLTVKWLITTIIPFLIIIFIASALGSLCGGAFLFLALLVACILVSNFTAVVFGYAFASVAIPIIYANPGEMVAGENLRPLWDMPVVHLLNNDTALCIGLLLGLLASFLQGKELIALLTYLQGIATNAVKFAILPLLPVFVVGSMLQMGHGNTFANAIDAYAAIFTAFCLAQLLYALLLYWLAAGYSTRLFLRYIKNIMPASLTGFITLSSAAAMPVTIIATEKNTGNQSLARTIIPATVNIHLVGTAIGMNVIILATFKLFGYPLPDLPSYMVYAVYFAIAQFAVVGVPGGSVFTMMPVVEAHLGATPGMLALISTMVVLFDPVDTSMNVSCNGAFAVIFKKAISAWVKLTKQGKNGQLAELIK